jgi:DNA gyrase/topoisomerase IV subunit B
MRPSSIRRASRLNEMERLLRAKAVLLPGVTVKLAIEREGQPDQEKVWTYPNGLPQYLAELLGDVETLIPAFGGERYADGDPTMAAVSPRAKARPGCSPGRKARWRRKASST